MRVVIFPCPIHYRASSVKSVPVAHAGTDGMGAPEEGLGAKPLPRYGRAGGRAFAGGIGGEAPSEAEAQEHFRCLSKAFWLRIMSSAS